jgi:hypothetical protein
MLPSGGPAKRVVVVSGRPVEGGPVRQVYFVSDAEAALCGIEGGPAMPVVLIQDKDLIQNGGQYWLDGNPVALPVYLVAVT